jgi:glycine amidinotransferase
MQLKNSAAQVHVECHTEWDRLRHVILGVADGASIPPPEPAFMARVDADSDVRGSCGPRTVDAVERANAQLDEFAHILEQRGVRVDRPTPIAVDQQAFSTLDFKLGPGSMFGWMSPRDCIITVGREILEAPMSFRSRYFEYLGYRDLISRYMAEDPGMRHEAAPRPRLTDRSFRLGYLADHISRKQRAAWVAERQFVTTEDEVLFDAADIVRLGRDLVVQHGFTTNLKGIDWLRRHFQNHRIHALNFPGDCFPSHIDCTFLPLRDGLILSNPTRPPLPEQVAPLVQAGWRIVSAAKPAHGRSPPLCYSSVWLSMNVLNLDAKTVCVEASEVHQMEQLDRLGFEVVPVPFRDVYPFGGGLHCATTDITRDANPPSAILPQKQIQ